MPLPLLLLAKPFLHVAGHVIHGLIHAGGAHAASAHHLTANQCAQILMQKAQERITNAVAKQVAKALCDAAGIKSQGFQHLLVALETGGDITIGELYETFAAAMEAECPKRKDGHPDMRYSKSKLWKQIKDGEWGADVIDEANSFMRGD